jgi:hypothetical protein
MVSGIREIVCGVKIARRCGVTPQSIYNAVLRLRRQQMGARRARRGPPVQDRAEVWTGDEHNTETALAPTVRFDYRVKPT